MDIKLIYETYFFRLYYMSKEMTGSKEDAEDIVSEVFYKVIKYNLLDGIDNVNAFLFKLTKNKTIDFLESKNRYNKHINIYLNIDREEEFINYELIADVIKSQAKKLTGANRKIFILLFIENMSYKDIVTFMNINYQSLRTSKLRMVKELRKLITKIKLSIYE